MLVRADDRGVDAGPLVVHVHLQHSEQPLPLALLRPAIEAVEHGLPRTELARQITARCPSTLDPQHRLDEASIIAASG
jgi:hypothetical protein